MARSWRIGRHETVKVTVHYNVLQHTKSALAFQRGINHAQIQEFERSSRLGHYSSDANANHPRLLTFALLMSVLSKVKVFGICDTPLSRV